MTVMRTLVRRAKRFAAGGAITLAGSAGLLAATTPAANAAVPSPVQSATQSIKYPGTIKFPGIKYEGSIKYPAIKWEGSIKYPGATAIEYGVRFPHITFPHITF